MNVLNFMLLCIISLVKNSDAHARMLNPPGRSSMWRYGYNVPVNYNDNELFCGGYRNTVLHGGRCGACGDPFQGPYENEAGGKYANGIIVRHYPKGGAFMEVTIDLTAYHKGYFEFRLCPHDNPDARVQQSCFEQYLLEISEGMEAGNPSRFYPEGPGIHHLKVKLPADVVCYQCVLQWKYTSGNFWGTDPDGRSCIGCGHQELFVNCADIAIGVGLTTEERHERVDIVNNPNNPTSDTTWIDKTSTIKVTEDVTLSKTTTPASSTPTTAFTTKTTKTIKGTRTIPTTAKPRTTNLQFPHNNGSDACNRCYALPTWKHFPQMDEWCDINCKNGNCPSCRCYCGCPDIVFQNPCKGQGDLAFDVKMDNWCWRECCEAECPIDKCACSADLRNLVRIPFTGSNENTRNTLPKTPSGTSNPIHPEHTFPENTKPDVESVTVSIETTENPQLAEEKRKVLAAFVGVNEPNPPTIEKTTVKSVSSESFNTNDNPIEHSTVTEMTTGTPVWGNSVHKPTQRNPISGSEFINSSPSAETKTTDNNNSANMQDVSDNSHVVSGERIHPNVELHNHLTPTLPNYGVFRDFMKKIKSYYLLHRIKTYGK